MDEKADNDLLQAPDPQNCRDKAEVAVKRLLIAGTSHVAALRVAWDNLAEKPAGLTVDYLAANAAEFRHFTINDTGVFGLHDESLAPENQRELARGFSGTLLRDIAQFTHVVMVGCTLNNIGLLRLLSACRVDDIRETATDLPRLSQAAFTAFSLSIAWNQYPAAILAGMTPLAKVALMSAPRFSEAILTDPKVEAQFQTIAAHPDGTRDALDLTDTAFAAGCANQGVTYIAPPAESLTPTGFSKFEYARNSVHIRVGKAPDHSHMDGEYGALCVRQILDWLDLGQVSSGRPATRKKHQPG